MVEFWFFFCLQLLTILMFGPGGNFGVVNSYDWCRLNCDGGTAICYETKCYGTSPAVRSYFCC